MLSRWLLAFAISAVFVGSSQHSLADWSEYIAAGGSIGLGASVTIGKEMGVADQMVGSWGTLLGVAKAIPEAVKRQQDYNLGLGTTVWEQTAITGSGMAVKSGLNTLLGACFSSGACALSGAGATVTAGTLTAVVGIGVDAYLVGKVVKSALDYRHELEQLAASLQKVKDLQHKVDQQAALKQQLQVLKNTNQWQDQRSAQLAQQKQITTPQVIEPKKPENQSAPVKLTTNPATTTDPQSRVPISARKPPSVSPPYVYTTPQPGKSETASLSPAELQRLKNNAVSLRPATSPPSPPPPPPAYVSPRAPYTGFQARAPGGISLSLAAAMRMRLDIDLDGMYFSNGRIVLSGRSDTGKGLDAALVLTAIRLACEPGDPYFSLDADNGRAWSEEGRQATEALLPSIRRDLGWDAPANWGRNAERGLRMRAVSLRRVYPVIGRELSAQYPNLKSRLVFHPDWLRQTRFGEILYKADVLLKELSTGVPMLESSTDVRATAIEGYVSSDARGTASTLLSSFENSSSRPETQQYRLWFDLLPQTDNSVALLIPELRMTPSPSGPGSELRKLLQSRGYIGTPAPHSAPASLVVDKSALDLSRVYPNMFVRRHDLASGQDLPGNDPNLDELANDVNGRIERYARAYKELRDLVEAFRAYVAAVKLTKDEGTACRKIRMIPILDGEKTSLPLPQHHPSEIAVTVATYIFSSGNQLRRLVGSIRSINGGISLRGKSFYDVKVPLGKPTAITQELQREIARSAQEPIWKSSTGRQFIALGLESDEALSETINLRSSKAATPEEVLRKQEESYRTIETRRRLDEEVRQQTENKIYQEKLKAWQEAQTKWEEIEKRRQEEARITATLGERQRLAAQFGPSIDRQTAAIVLPYALMSRDVYGDDAKNITTVGVTQVAEWQALFRDAGYSEKQILLIKASGFYAAIYQNERTGEVTIAYRGPLDELPNDTLERLANIDIQYKSAADLAWIVKRQWPHVSISLTGYALGGDRAAFAAEQTGIAKVRTFNAPSAAVFTNSLNSDRINIGWVDRRS